MNKYTFLTDNIDNEFLTTTPSEDDILGLNETVQDDGYITFIKNVANGGFFFNRSLQIYSVGTAESFNDIFSLNKQIQLIYRTILVDEFFFAQDVFGNQFGFSSKGIVFFNIETGEKEYIGKSFDDWTERLKSDFDYYTGESILLGWIQQWSDLNYNERLCPTIPFVVGGEYEIENLFKSTYPNYLLNNFNIANQVYNLPEGTPIKLRKVD